MTETAAVETAAAPEPSHEHAPPEASGAPEPLSWRPWGTQGVLAAVRAGSPYTPLPSSIPGDRASFTLPIVSGPVPK